MLTVRFFFFIFVSVSYFISNSAKSFSGFENNKTCITIKSNASTKTVVVKKTNSSTVVIWTLLNDTWVASLGNSYMNTIEAYDSTIKKLKFCFKNTSRNNSGHYEWTDEQRNIDTFKLQVWYGPTDLVISPKSEESLTLYENETERINCSADCNPNCIITWKKDIDTTITESTAKSSLLLNNVSENDSGDYTCLAENPENKSHSLSKQLSIFVQYAAKIKPTIKIENQVKEYSKTNLSCRVDSYPFSNISWLRGNKELNTTYSAKNEVVLHFENTSCDDTGVYQCSAFNGIGQKDNKDFKLNVLCKPRFVNHFENVLETNVTTFIGGEIEMNVSLQAHPSPEVLRNDFGFDTEFFETSNTMFNVALKKLVLSEYDFRRHTLIIGNSQGNLTIVIEVENKRRNSALFYGYVIGTPMIIGITLIVLILISIFVLILTVIKIKSRKHCKDNQANNNSTNDDDTGGYRDNILYQSIDSVSFQAKDLNFDDLNSDIFDSQVSSSIQNVNECLEEDEESKIETKELKDGYLNTEQDSNLKINTIKDKIKGRKPVPRPRKTKPFTRNSNELQQPEFKEISKCEKDVMSKKELACKAVQAENKATFPLNSDDDSNFSISDEKQFCLSHGNYRNHVANDFAATSAQKIVKRHKEDLSLMNSFKVSEYPAKYPGLLSNYLQTNIEQDTKRNKPQMHSVKPFNLNIEVGCVSKTILQHGDEYTESKHVADYENVSIDGYTTKNEDDPYQYHDYMNL